MSAFIDGLVQLIKTARYGKDVRDSICDAITGIDNVAEGAVGSATAAATAANTSATNAESYKNAAVSSATNAANSAQEANKAVEMCEAIAAAIGNPLAPKGTIAFSELPNLSDVQIGWEYNINDDFTTDSRFIEGAGIQYKAGNNIYCIEIDNEKYWDVLAGQSLIVVDDDVIEGSQNPVSGAAVYDELSQIKNDLADIGKKKNASVSSSHNITYFKRVDIGDTVTLKFHMTLTSNVSAWQTIAQISGLSLEYPNYDYVINNGANCIAYLSTSGALQLAQAGTSGKEVYGTIQIIK